MTLTDKILGKEQCFIIAEVAQSHDGSLGMAHAFIDAAATTGADAIKFQTHIAAEESTAQEQWRVKFSYEDDSRYDYWKRMEFTYEQWEGLKKHADDKGLVFLSSPFSVKAVDWLEKLGMPAWKIASGEITNLPMLERIFETKKPLLISSGMSDIAELETLVHKVREHDLSFALFQCTSAYPTPPEKIGLNVMQFFHEKFMCPVGLSDHSGTIFPSMAATTLGANIIEVHLTLSRHMFGPDVIASVDVEEMKKLVEGVRFTERMIKNPVQKTEASQAMSGMRGLFNKSIVAREALQEGQIIGPEHLAYKKPGMGIPASKYRELVGKKLRMNVEADHFFQESDFQD